MKTIKFTLNIIVYLMLVIIMICSVTAAQPTVDLGTAGDFAVLAKSGISTTGVTAITGDIGVSPIGSTAITGFALIMDSSNQFATSSALTGKVYASDYTLPAPTKMTSAISDMERAYADAAGRVLPDTTELGAGDISGLTLAPGLHKWGTGVMINGDVTLSGSSTDIWIFQIGQDLNVGNGATVTLTGGAQAKNIFWQVSGQTTLGTTSQFKGIILSKTAIAMNTGSTVLGRALAQTAVTLNANTVTAPTSAPVVVIDTDSDNSDSTQTNDDPIGDSVEEKSIEVIEQETPEVTIDQETTIIVAEEEESDDDTQEKERNEKIRTGNYDVSSDQELKVRALAQNKMELESGDVSAKTNLSITAETNSQGKTKLQVMLRSGQNSEIKIMPNAASEIALEKLRLNVCSPYNNCTITLKDVGNGVTENIQYEVQIDRHSKIIGLFEAKMHVTVDVDAETGEVLNVHKPWWAFIATEAAE